MTEPTTSAEALAEAIYIASFPVGSDIDWRADWRGQSSGIQRGTTRSVRPVDSPAILAALPEPWRLIDVVADEVEWDEVIAEERAEAAQQERERILAQIEALKEDTGGWYWRGASERNSALVEILALFADPEPA